MKIYKYVEKEIIETIYHFMQDKFSLIKTVDNIPPDVRGNVSIDLAGKVIKAAYPVGGIYVTVLKDQDPSTFLGGTWVRLNRTDKSNNLRGGLCITTAGTSYPVRSNANADYIMQSINGSNSITLTATQIPKHSHKATFSLSTAGGHTHDRGTWEITGALGTGAQPSVSYEQGAFYWQGEYGGHGGHKGDWRNLAYFQASRAWTGRTNTTGNHTHAIRNLTVAESGGDSSGKTLPFTYQAKGIPLNFWVRIA